MDALKRLARRAGTGAGAEVALGLAMAMVIALDALVTARVNSAWPSGVGVGITICTTAMLRGWNRAWAAVTGLVLCAAAGLATALGIADPGPLFGGGLIGLLVLGAAAVRELPFRPAIIIGVVGALVVAVSETAGPDGLFDQRALHALTGATLWAAALAVGLWRRYLDVRHHQTVDAVRRQERLELARELHDVVAHHVTGMVVQAQAARFTGDDHPDRLMSALDGIESAGLDTLAAIRQLVGLLRDPGDTGEVSPAPEPISQLVRRFAEHGPAVDLRLPADPATSTWPPQVASTTYRIIQEALTNIARHAPAAHSVTVTITHDPHQVHVEITDDAPATAPRHTQPASGYGLVGMRERVEALGGKLHAGPLPCTGWAVRASLPVPAHTRP